MTKIKNIYLLYLLIFLEILLLTKSKIVITSVINSSVMFILKIFPSLFPTMIIGNLLVKNNIHQIIPKFIKRMFYKLFRFNNIMTSIFIISMFTGTPSNALYINEYLNKKLISVKQAQTLLLTTHFINPLFVIAGVGIGVFNSVKIGFILLILLWTNNIIKAFIRKKNLDNDINNNQLSTNNETFINTLSNSIKISINSLLLIFGIVVMFNMLVALLKNIFNFNPIISSIINGILEMTGGVISLSNLYINPIIKFILAFFFLNFGGLCIQMQTLSMIENKKISYLKYLIFRLF